MSPLRVPIIIPASGVNPIDVSTLIPPSTAHILAPLPRCKTIVFTSSKGLFNFLATSCETNLWLVPWKPYLRTPYFSYHSYGTPYRYVSSFIVWWNAVSKTATPLIFGKAFWNALIPVRFAGLWSGAKSLTSSIAFITSSVITTLSLNFSPPWTTRWPTPSISLIDFNICKSISFFNNKLTATLWSLHVNRSFNFSPFSLIVISE